ncbi:Predicted metal-dependent hydrolase, TIM-barrel fold [Variovorax sp. HW608]|uniref:amidohydrolase family protein n=1 Tax=Variovorax sp. HW608 TaxID=1034889 RepID=UPI00081FA6FC|nr:amidohydrolase family protein [Variovorax sp. HW608]SCK26884.1 Predicted metal-dependent hydrolase, TIM-barrel fold [Variovorax sp. HW608]
MPASRCSRRRVPADVPYSAGSQPPGPAVPAGACDCHLHVYDSRFPTAPGARLLPPDASISDYRLLQQRIGTHRAVLVTPSTYGTDNRVMLQALAALGPDGRGVAVIDGSESDEQLDELHAQGVRGVRLNLSLGLTGSVEMLEPIAHRIADLGWHLQLLMPADVLASLGNTLGQLPVQLVFDHFGRIAPAQQGTHRAHALVLALLREGRAWVKLSGGYVVSPQSSTDDPALASLARSYLQASPGRVVWGTDWPHATASAGLHPMPDDARQMDRLADWTADADLFRRVLVDNPSALYGFA